MPDAHEQGAWARVQKLSVQWLLCNICSTFTITKLAYNYIIQCAGQSNTANQPDAFGALLTYL